MKGITILYEDEKLLCLNKPAGLAVQGGAGVGVSLDSLLSMAYQEPPLLVHRLDKDTSGVIVTAKTRESAAACSALFADHQGGLKKTYLAFCGGIPGKTGTIDETLVVKGKSLEARTSYGLRGTAFLADFPRPGGGSASGHARGSAETPVSLVQLEPATGRMHQIRRHLARRGYPVLGDDKYGDFALNRRLKKLLGLKRLLLHAFSVYLPPPLVRGGLLVSAPLPDHFCDFIQKTGQFHINEAGAPFSLPSL
jgi:23S rRNA pseudouridine955/2504/2580 synthase